MEIYQWIKALHLISVIAWMAGLLYLPRLYVYHCDAEPGSDKSETFKVMERRLLRAIMNPAMIGAYVFGLWLLYLSEAWTEAWMMTKLVLIGAMTMANEVPTVLIIAIVVLVIVQPF